MKSFFAMERLFTIFNKTLPVLLGIIVFFNPWPNLTAIHEISFYLSMTILALLLIFKKTGFSLNTPLSLAFGLFVLWSFFGLFFALNKENSINDFYAHLIKYLILFYLVFNYYNSKGRFLSLVWTIVISTSLYGLGILLYFYLISGHPFSIKLGLFMEGEIPSNLIGILTLFALLLTLRHIAEAGAKFQKVVLSICLFILTVATLATQTRGTVLAMVIALFLMFFNFKNKKLMLIFFLFLSVTIFLMPIKSILTPDNLSIKIKAEATVNRVNIWRAFGEMIKDYPLTGIGFGMQTYFDENLLNKYYERVRVPSHSRVSAPHNLFIDVAVRTGLVGLAFFCYILASFIRMGWKLIRYGENHFIREWGLCLMAAFVAIIVQGMFENTLSGPSAIVLYIIMAMMTILWHLNRRETKQKHRMKIRSEG
jgi:O-antigen ligase